MVCSLCGRSGHSVRTCSLPGAGLHRNLLKLHTAPSKQEGRRPPRFGQATPRKAKRNNASDYSGRKVQLEQFQHFCFHAVLANVVSMWESQT